MIDKIKTSEIEASLVIINNNYEILIIGKNKVVNITNFQQEKLAQLFLLYLNEAIDELQQKLPKSLDGKLQDER